MAMFRSNPTINKLGGMDLAQGGATATYGGVAAKTLYYVGLVLISAIAMAVLILKFPTVAVVMLVVSLIGSLVFGFWTAFSPNSAAVTGSLYTIFQGMLVGALSFVYNFYYSGIILAALLATIVTLGVMMALYYSKAIRVTTKMRKFVFTALISVVIANLLFMLLGIFIPGFYQAVYFSGFGILICIGMILLAAFMLLIDLDNITRIVEGGMSKKYEWFAAYGLVLTLIWLYMEFLRLFAILASRRN